MAPEVETVVIYRVIVHEGTIYMEITGREGTSFDGFTFTGILTPVQSAVLGAKLISSAKIATRDPKHSDS